MVLAGLNDAGRGSFQVLSDLVNDKIERLRIVNRVVGGKTGVSSETRFGFLVGIVLGRRRCFFGLEFGKKRVSGRSKLEAWQSMVWHGTGASSGRG